MHYKKYFIGILLSVWLYPSQDILAAAAGDLPEFTAAGAAVAPVPHELHMRDPRVPGYLLDAFRLYQSNPAEARRQLKIAADRESGDVNHMLYAYACLSNEGGGVEDLPEARKYYKFAANKGSARAQKRYADMCAYGKGGDLDTEEARTYYELAHAQGFKDLVRISRWDPSQAILAAAAGAAVAPMAFREHPFFKANPKIAREYYKSSADKHGTVYNMLYANMCMQGKGGDLDEEEALTYYMYAAEEGFEDAVTHLAEARAKYKALAELGDKEGREKYSGMCFLGIGGNVDLFDAEKYAADQGVMTHRIIMHVL